ncbi:MAG: LON peptidase substrate-binding domain-containing protein [Crenarchaeota archaeon]|nr:LON peptidase substrate-binding domain-containing protein [Thermoproteota archaeon]MDA1124191.1 LON peptidase substrate-binding domain-containing protein [Thermoproteota archaeon]
MSETKIIPIFPLDLVLFPNQDLPLRIFEPRYKQMIDDCMLGEKEFGVCLGHDSATISNWQAPYNIGTLAKIVDCKDVDSTSGHLFVNVRGRRKFRIIRLISPSLKKTDDYDPFTIEGAKTVEQLHHNDGVAKKMYIQAEIELISEIDESISLNDWETLVDLWKNKIKKTNDNPDLTSHQLDHVLEQYYLKTETPTMEYVHSLCALASQTPLDLQPILESTNLEQLLQRTTKLLESDKNHE